MRRPLLTVTRKDNAFHGRQTLVAAVRLRSLNRRSRHGGSTETEIMLSDEIVDGRL